MLIYATKLDLAKYATGDPDATEDQAPADALKQIQSASILIRRATSRDIYAVDDDGYPTKASLVEAFKDATCAMAAAYSTLGLNVQAGAASNAQVVVSKSLGSASVSYADASAQAQAKAALADGRTLTGEAYSHLKSAGLMSSAVFSDDPTVGVYASGPWPVS